MKTTLKELNRISMEDEKIGKEIRNEARIFKMEPSERLKLGLEGQAAIDHYNEWMRKYGMNDMIVK